MRVKKIEADFNEYYMWDVVVHVDNNGKNTVMNFDMCVVSVARYKNLMVERYSMENTYKTKELAFLLAVDNKFPKVDDYWPFEFYYDEVELDIKDLDIHQ